MSTRWECALCGCQRKERRKKWCPNCGLIQVGPATYQKYQILEDYCHPLSLIMRNQGYEHYFIDCCAGSGVVQAWSSNELIDGSPLIMAKTKDWVENKIRVKTKEPSVQCKFIECNSKVFKILEDQLESYSEFVECIQDDCNAELENIVDEISRAFAFVYIDPFGLGDPVIRHETVGQMIERKFTELFIHFSWQGVSRTTGQLTNIDHPDANRRKKARKTVETLNAHIGTEWQEICKKRIPSSRRRDLILKSYVSKLQRHYRGIKYVEIPFNSKNPYYYLIFTTRNKTGYKIMEQIIEKKRREGVAPLNDFHSFRN